MPTTSRYLAFRVAAAVAPLAAVLTWLAFSREPARVVEAPDPWYIWLLMPAFIGMILSGGVHGSAPGWVMLFAMCLSNAACWSLLAYLTIKAYISARRTAVGR